jgi:hypothetical protein
MERSGQDKANHTRWFPMFHFFAMPILLIHLICSGVRAWQNPGWEALEGVLFALAVVVVGLASRMMALKAQDRVIRLEEHLRLQRVVPAELAAKAISALDEGQLIALRFASDGELAGLVGKVLAGNPSKPAEIKNAITKWRGDYYRV